MTQLDILADLAEHVPVDGLFNLAPTSTKDARILYQFHQSGLVLHLLETPLELLQTLAASSRTDVSQITSELHDLARKVLDPAPDILELTIFAVYGLLVELSDIVNKVALGPGLDQLIDSLRASGNFAELEHSVDEVLLVLDDFLGLFVGLENLSGFAELQAKTVLVELLLLHQRVSAVFLEGEFVKRILQVGLRGSLLSQLLLQISVLRGKLLDLGVLLRSEVVDLCLLLVNQRLHFAYV